MTPIQEEYPVGWYFKTGDGKTSRGATGRNSGISIFRRRRGMPNQVTPRA